MNHPFSSKPTTNTPPYAGACASSAAFTAVELLVIVGLLALFVSVLAPALGRTQGRSRDFVCLHNLHQLMTGMLMYAELFPPNPDDGNSVVGHNWCQGMAGVGGSSEFNTDILKNPARSLLTPYIGTNAALFRCAADIRTGRSMDTSTFGSIVPAARSISMSQAVGTICPGYSAGAGHSGVPTLPVNGPWLTGYFGQNRANSPWRTYGKTSDLVAPAPSRIWVLIEETPYSLNDASFASSAGRPAWVDFVGYNHNNAGCLAFGDGHSELHKWLEKSTILTSASASQRVLSPQDRDWLWLAARTSVKVQ